MQWTDDGIVLAARKHGESAAIVSLLTAGHGRHVGLVRGGAGRRQRGVTQPGNRVRATWRARLAENLGSYTLELSYSGAGRLLGLPERLAGLAAACAVVEMAVPEREPHPVLYQAMTALLQALLDSDAWAAVYVRFEVGLLQELGFGLDLSRCAMTGAREGLAYVSPKSGRAVTEAAAEPWKNQLLRLPRFLLGGQAGGIAAGDLRDGLQLSGHFLERHVLASAGKAMPAARTRLLEQFSKETTRSSAILPS